MRDYFAAQNADLEPSEMDSTSSIDTPVTAEKLMAKGKKGAASYILKTRDRQLLDNLLDIVLDPVVPLSLDTIDWIKWLIAGGSTPDEFAAKVQEYDSAAMCGLVWTANFVAYRCRTCGVSPCMSICGECFHNGEHEGHDFNMFRSQAGGACDCGDASVMKPSGFCKRHSGTSCESQKNSPPLDLLLMAKFIMPRLFYRLVLHLRTNNVDVLRPPPGASTVFDGEAYVCMLNDFCAMGAAMRKVMTEALTSRKVYNKMNLVDADDKSLTAQYIRSSKKMYYGAISKFYYTTAESCMTDPLEMQPKLYHNSFLEEIMFWNVRYAFPQKIVCFLLNMLPDTDYKNALTKTFVLHYNRIALILQHTEDPETLSNRVVHVSVQLFSNEELASRMTNEYSLLRIMVASLNQMMSNILVKCKLCTRLMLITARQLKFHPEIETFYDCEHKVVDCSKDIMKEHCYWPIVSDLNNILSHRPIAVEFMSNEELLDSWFCFLKNFQGMNVNKREVLSHVEHEPNTYYAAFSAEIEASAYPMWALLSHLNTNSSHALTEKVLKSCLAALKKWLPNYSKVSSEKERYFSFHIPLHRYFAAFISQALNVQKMDISKLLPPALLLHDIMIEPLRIQVAFYEIINGLWVRNGLQIKGQAMTYVQCNFCSSMVDADLYLLQICAASLNPEEFLYPAMLRFRVETAFSLREEVRYGDEPDVAWSMAESFIQFIATLATVRTNLGMSCMKFTRVELVSLLCISDKTHSQLIEQMPERCGVAHVHVKDFETVLEQVAEYKGPNFEATGALQQGMYIPKPCAWLEHFDPIHVLLRAVYKRDFQATMDRYTNCVRSAGLIGRNEIPWPPYRIPEKLPDGYPDPQKIMNCRVMHAVIWVILYKAVHTDVIHDHILSLTLFLLELAVVNAFDIPVRSTSACSSDSEASPHCREKVATDLNFGCWYDTDSLKENLSTVIVKVVKPAELVARIENSYASNFLIMSPSQVRSSLLHLLEEKIRSKLETSSRYSLLDLLKESVLSESGTSSDSGASTLGEKIRVRPPGGFPEEHFPGEFPTMFPLAKKKKSTTLDTTPESLITLLLKLHSKLSGKQNSFDPTLYTQSDLNNRVSDSVAFVGKLLTRIMHLDDGCRSEVLAARNRLWPESRDEEEERRKEQENRKATERKMLISRRQEAVMETFRNMQKKFMDKVKESGEDSMDWEGNTDSDVPKEESTITYTCVICNCTSVSKDDSLMAAIVFFQASSVVANCRSKTEVPRLPLSDEDGPAVLRDEKLSHHYNQLLLNMDDEFSKFRVTAALNVLWEGGIIVQSCGHYVHMDCFNSYMISSITGPQRSYLDREEFPCPLCRRIANGVLPVPPDMDCSFMPEHTDDFEKRVQRFVDSLYNIMLIGRKIPLQNPNLMQYMTGALDSMADFTYPQYLARCEPREMENIFLFLTSVGRINIDLEIIQRGGTLVDVTESNTLLPKRSAMPILLRMLSFHGGYSAYLNYLQDTCSQLVRKYIVPQTVRDVPMLLRDTYVILLQFTISIPVKLSSAYYEIIVKMVYNLAFFQVAMKLLCSMNESDRNYWRSSGTSGNTTSHLQISTINEAVTYIVTQMENFSMYLWDSDESAPKDRSMNIRNNIEARIRELSLPFLRFASIIKSHLSDTSLPRNLTANSEYVGLAKYLCLLPQSADRDSGNSSSLITLFDNTGQNFVCWFKELASYYTRNELLAKSFVCSLHPKFYLPRLIELPYEYDKIFQYYHKKPCKNCNLVPREPSICLMCGKLVCLKQTCCKEGLVFEAVQHSVDCGGSTGIYLIVPSSLIMVIRGKRACLWGSVYLDTFGEEDRELKRGRPLYLSSERYTLLQQQWMLHRFNQTTRKWIWHRDQL